jgi:hypothetical protein
MDQVMVIDQLEPGMSGGRDGAMPGPIGKSSFLGLEDSYPIGLDMASSLSSSSLALIV